MIYLYGYLGIGVAVLLVVFISHRLSVKSEPDLHAILDSLHPERDTWHYKLINKVLVPLLVAIIMPCVWPVIIYWKAKELISRNKVEAEPEEKDEELSVNHSDLIKHIPISKIEALERIIDPLGAVPDLPFGHLNSAWEKFKANTQADDEVWTFKSTWDRRWLKQECRGYAILRGNEVPHHWMTGWENIEPPPKPPEPVPTFEEMERRLTDKNWEVRWVATQVEQYKPTAKQIERGLRDKERQVRLAFAKRYDLTLTPEHIEIGLTDKDDSVREVFSYRNDYTLTPEQLERGLTDERSVNRFRILERRECVLTPAQIERGLTDKDCYVRWGSAEREDFTTPTAIQIERGLTDSFCEVRLAFAKRTDIFFTQAQIERGLQDKFKDVRDVFAALMDSPTPRTT